MLAHLHALGAIVATIAAAAASAEAPLLIALMQRWQHQAHRRAPHA